MADMAGFFDILEFYRPGISGQRLYVRGFLHPLERTAGTSLAC